MPSKVERWLASKAKKQEGTATDKIRADRALDSGSEEFRVGAELDRYVGKASALAPYSPAPTTEQPTYVEQTPLERKEQTLVSAARQRAEKRKTAGDDYYKKEYGMSKAEYDKEYDAIDRMSAVREARSDMQEIEDTAKARTEEKVALAPLVKEYKDAFIGILPESAYAWHSPVGDKEEIKEDIVLDYLMTLPAEERYAQLEKAAYRSTIVPRIEALKEKATQFMNEESERITAMQKYVPVPSYSAAAGMQLGASGTWESPVEYLEDLYTSVKKDDFKSGFVEAADWRDFISFGLASLGGDAAKLQALQKAYKGEPLTEKDEFFIEVAEIEQALEDFRKEKGGASFWNSLGSGAAHSSQFLAEMAMTGGLGGAAKLATGGIKQAFKQGVGRGLAHLAVKNVPKTLAYGAKRSPLMAGTYRNLMGRRINQYSVANGQVDLTKPESLWKSIGVAWADQTFEIASELWGNMLHLGFGKIGKAIGADKWLKTKSVSFKTTPAMRRIFRDGLLWSGDIPSEMTSEFLGDVATNLAYSAFNKDEQYWGELFTRDYWGNLLALTAGLKAGVTVASIPSIVDSNKKMKQLEARSSAAFNAIGNEELKNKVLNLGGRTDIEDVAEYMHSIEWSQYKPIEVAHAIDYMMSEVERQVVAGSEAEQERAERYAPRLARIQELAYRNAEGVAMPTMVTAEANFGVDNTQGVTILEGDYTNPEAMVRVRLADGTTDVVLGEKLSNVQETDMSALVAEDYAMTFAEEDAMETLGEVEQTLFDMQRTGASNTQQIRAVEKAGLTVFNEGEVVTLLNGEEATVVEGFRHGLYTVMRADGSLSMVGVGGILQPDVAIAQAQRSAAMPQEQTPLTQSTPLPEDIDTTTDYATPDGFVGKAVDYNAESDQVTLQSADGGLTNVPRASLTVANAEQTAPQEDATENLATETISEMEQSEAEETPMPVAPQTAPIPQNEDGSVDYESMTDATMYANAIESDMGNVADAQGAVVDVRQSKEAELAKLQEQKKQTANMNEKVALKQQEQKLVQQIAMLNEVESILGSRATAVEAETAQVNEAVETAPIAETTEQKKPTEPMRAIAEGVKENDFATQLRNENPAEYNTFNALAKLLGLEIEFVESAGEGNALIVGNKMQVAYNPANREETLRFLIGHESLHRLKSVAPEAYAELMEDVKSYIGEELFGQRVERLRVRYEHQGIAITEESLQEEVVADFIGEMEEDYNVVSDLVTNNPNKSWWQKLIEGLRNLFAFLEGASADTAKVASILNKIETAYKTAAEKVQTLEVETVNGEVSAEINEAEGQAKLSIRTYEEGGRATLVDFLQKQQAKDALTAEEADDILAQMDNLYTICKDYKDKYAPFGQWSDASVVVGEDGKPVFSVIKKNGEYAMNLDFSLVCKKRRTLDAVLNEMVKRGLIEGISVSETTIAKINEVIRRYGFETACALCFVDARRFRVLKVAKDFADLYNSVVDKLIPKGSNIAVNEFNYGGREDVVEKENALDTMADESLNISALQKMSEGKSVKARIARHLLDNPQDRKYVTPSDFVSTAGFDNVAAHNVPLLKLYNAKKGTGGPKAAFSDVQYLNDIAKKNWSVEDAFAVGGVRIQSFSDFVPRMVFDYMQMVAELAGKKLPAHAYTKEAIFAKMFGLTGIKINLSLVPDVVEGGVAAGLDANGDYVWREGETFPYEEAVALQNAEGYKENCGTIAVGVSDEHILKMLDDPHIRMVIPYHKSGLNPLVAKMNNIGAYKDYTKEQSTRTAKGNSRTKEQKAQLPEPSFNELLRESNSPMEAAQKYLDWCKEHNLKPKFDRFASHPNYYKLLEDFTTYVDGAYVPQRSVTMTYPTADNAFGSISELIAQGLEEDAILEGQRDAKVSQMVDEIEGAKFSLREGNTFYSNAEFAVRNIRQEKATPEQWLKMIGKNGGLKAGEDKWLGLSDWLKASDKKTLTKEEMLGYIHQNQIQIEEVNYDENGYDNVTAEEVEQSEEFSNLVAQLTKSDYNEDTNEYGPEYIDMELFDEMAELNPHFADGFAVNYFGSEIYVNDPEEASVYLGLNSDNRRIEDMRLDYTTKGLENKREIALTVPTIESWNESDQIHFGDAGGGRAIAWIRFGETTDPDGKRVLVIDEIQSKRHQEGREKGYRDDAELTRLGDREKTLLDESVSIVKDILHKQGYIHHSEAEAGVDGRFDVDVQIKAEEGKLGSKEQMDRIKAITHEINDIIVAESNIYINSVPEAPFEKNWAELAMKRMLRYAAENGFDKVAWTTGNQQAERYSIGGVISKIGKNESNNIDEQVFEVGLAGAESMLYLTTDNNGKIIHSLASEYVGRTLSEVFGKELAIKMLNAKENTAIEGEGLRIGGEGMRAFYDQMLPSFMRKYGKKWGATVGEVTMPNLEENTTMHSVDVTPAMRESVMQGQPMFSLRNPEWQSQFGVPLANGKELSLEDVRTLFEKTNKRKVLQQMFDKVYEVMEKLPYYGIIVTSQMPEGSEDSLGVADGKGNILLNVRMFQEISNKGIATTILHEMIHSATTYATIAYEERKENPEAYEALPENIKTACQRLQNIYDFLLKRNNLKEEYGMTSIHEMLAELSNPQFRALLREEGVWEKIVNALKRFFGIGTGKTVKELDETLKTFLENFDRGAYVETVEAIAGEKVFERKVDAKEADAYSDVMYSLKSLDAPYLDAVARGDMATAQRMVREAAERAGYTEEVYHGTDKFGFTTFNSRRPSGAIFTSDKAYVTANYGGDDKYASVRNINKGVRVARNPQDVIANARSVFNQDWRFATEEDKNAVIERVEATAKKMRDEMVSRQVDMPEELREDVAWIENIIYDAADARANGNEGNELAEMLSREYELYKESKGNLRNYEAYDSLTQEQKDYLTFLTGYELADVAIDAGFSYANAVSEKLMATVDGNSFVGIDALEDNTTEAKNVGSYHLYGNLGNNPLEVDAEGKEWFALDFNGMRTTDAIAEWAEENGYSSVVFKNIYDYGDKSDVKVFYNSNQLKSADVVTYDDAGNIIPLSERFNPEKEDIRYSLRDDVRNILDAYDLGDDYRNYGTIHDVADRIEEVVDDYDGEEDITQLRDILNAFRSAQEDSRNWGERMDSGGEEGFENALRLYASQPSYSLREATGEEVKEYLTDALQAAKANRLKQIDKRYNYISDTAKKGRRPFIIGDMDAALALADPDGKEGLSLELQIAYDIANGLKFRWADSEGGIYKGLQQAIGDRKSVAGILDAQEGAYLNEYATRLAEQVGMSAEDVQKVVVNVVRNNPSRKAAIKTLGKDIPFEYNERVEQAIEDSRARAKGKASAEFEAALNSPDGNTPYARLMQDEAVEIVRASDVLRDMRAEIRGLRKRHAESKYEQAVRIEKVRKRITDMVGTYFGRNMNAAEIKTLVNLISKAHTPEALERALDMIQRQEFNVQYRMQRQRKGRLLQNRISFAFTGNEMSVEQYLRQEGVDDATIKRLLSDRFKGVDAKGISVAKFVSAEVAKLMELVNNNINLTKDIEEQYSDFVNALNEAMQKVPTALLNNETLRSAIETLPTIMRMYWQVDEMVNSAKTYESDLKRLNDKIKEAEEAITFRPENMSDEAYEERTDQFSQVLKELIQLRDALMRQHLADMPAIVKLMTEANNAIEQMLLGGKQLLSEERKALERHKREVLQDAEMDITNYGQDYDALRADATRHKTSKERAKKEEKKRGLLSGIMSETFDSLDQMLRKMGSDSASGMGRTHQRIMGGLIKATNLMRDNINDVDDAINRKLRQLWGGIKGYRSLEDIIYQSQKIVVGSWNYARVANEARVVIEAGKPRTVYEEQTRTFNTELTLGQALYVLSAWNQADGRLKLEHNGFTQDDINSIMRAIADVDARWLDLMDFVIDELLPSRRDYYDEVHRRVNGAYMARVENYFPLKISGEEVYKEADLDAMSITEATIIPSAIINRTHNTKMIDLDVDFFKVLLENVTDMERWAAMVEIRQDMTTILSDTRTRNMMEQKYGVNFVADLERAMKVAVGTYTCKIPTTAEKALLYITRRWAGSRIAGRISTALKQLVGIGAYITYATSWAYWLKVFKVMRHPVQNIKEALEMFPMLQQRWRSASSGDVLLQQFNHTVNVKTEGKLEWKQFDAWLDKVTRLGIMPNAAVDLFVSAVMAKATYEWEMERYLNQGFSREIAEQKAKIDAELSYNLTQQSAETMFIGSLQASPSLVSRAATTFMNNPIANIRLGMQGFADIQRALKWQRVLHNERNRLAIEYRKQFIAEGMDEEQAGILAEQKALREVQKTKKGGVVWRGIKKMLWGYFLNATTFTLAGGIWLLCKYWDDDEKLDEMGLTGTDLLWTTVASPFQAIPVAKQLTDLLIYGKTSFIPMLDDALREFEGLRQYIENDNVSPSAVYAFSNAVLSLGVGIDMNTWINMSDGVVDMFNGDWDAGVAKLINKPKSQIKLLIGDRKDGETAKEYMTRVMRTMSIVDKNKIDVAELENYNFELGKWEKPTNISAAEKRKVSEIYRQYQAEYKKDMLKRCSEEVRTDYPEIVEKHAEILKDMGVQDTKLALVRYYEQMVDTLTPEVASALERLAVLQAEISVTERNLDLLVSQDGKEYIDLLTQEFNLRKEFVAQYEIYKNLTK